MPFFLFVSSFFKTHRPESLDSKTGQVSGPRETGPDLEVGTRDEGEGWGFEADHCEAL